MIFKMYSTFDWRFSHVLILYSNCIHFGMAYISSINVVCGSRVISISHLIKHVLSSFQWYAISHWMGQNYFLNYVTKLLGILLFLFVLFRGKLKFSSPLDLSKSCIRHWWEDEARSRKSSKKRCVHLLTLEPYHTVYIYQLVKNRTFRFFQSDYPGHKITSG